MRSLPNDKLEKIEAQIDTSMAATENAAKDVETESRHRPSGSIKSTNSSISIISGSSKTVSEAFTNQSNSKSTMNSKHNSKKGIFELFYTLVESTIDFFVLKLHLKDFSTTSYFRR